MKNVTRNSDQLGLLLEHIWVSKRVAALTIILYSTMHTLLPCNILHTPNPTDAIWEP